MARLLPAYSSGISSVDEVLPVYMTVSDKALTILPRCLVGSFSDVSTCNGVACVMSGLAQTLIDGDTFAYSSIPRGEVTISLATLLGFKSYGV